MCFSWDDFLAGNKNPADKINLGLHEFGHALRFNGIKGHETDYFFENYFPKWVACASKEFVKLKNTNSSILRKYGSVNINEFFSVVVETFFENPLEFKTYMPDLFRQTSILLNQTFNNNLWELNCRELLLKENLFSLKSSFQSVFKYNFTTSSYLVGVIGFLVVAIFSSLGEGYKYPPPYICFGISTFFWYLLERSFTRISFHQNSFTINKGFLFLKDYKTETLPGAQLISLVGKLYDVNDDNGYWQKTMCLFTVTHYKENAFYEDDINCEVNKAEFEKLRAELKQNYVHVFIQY